MLMDGYHGKAKGDYGIRMSVPSLFIGAKGG